MKTNQRELFENNCITEAICQFTFKQPLSSEMIEGLATRIGSKYTELENIPLIHFNFDLNNTNPSRSDSNGLRAFTQNRKKIIQIYTDNISVHQIGGYQTWEVFRDDIYFVLDKLKNLIPIEIGRIDLRTINVFEFDKEVNAVDYFHVSMTYPKSFIQHSNFQFNLEQIYKQGKSAGVIRGNYTRENGNLKFILDLSYINWMLDENINIEKLEEIKNKLEDGHLKNYNLFIDAITDKTRELIKLK